MFYQAPEEPKRDDYPPKAEKAQLVTAHRRRKRQPQPAQIQIIRRLISALSPGNQSAALSRRLLR